VLVFAVDHFDKIRLCHGQPAGDLIVKEVASVVSQVLRAGDVFARYNGERFTVLARDLDDEGSVILAQRIRKIIRDHTCEFDGAPIPLTVSIGIATLADKPEKASDLIRIAEESLEKTVMEAGENGIGGAAVATYLQSSDNIPTVHYSPSAEG
jgi:diguanylate cyclase